jgi:hypothetical protein
MAPELFATHGIWVVIPFGVKTLKPKTHPTGSQLGASVVGAADSGEDQSLRCLPSSTGGAIMTCSNPPANGK